jgi:hypothetical protein
LRERVEQQGGEKNDNDEDEKKEKNSRGQEQ